MADIQRIEDYLADGGKLTSPANVPARYRAELLRLMASFVDSEMAGAAGLAERINDAPSLTARVLAARIVAEKFEHARRVLDLMAEFGADTARYVSHHPWTERLPRDADIGASRHGTDMRLNVFHYPLTGWVDAVAMSFLMGRATDVQLGELAQVSYQPLADAFAEIAPAEAAHAAHAEKGLRAIVADPAGRVEAQASIDYWLPRVAATFGAARSDRFEALKAYGLRHTPNDTLLSWWREGVTAAVSDLGLRISI